MIVSGLKFEDLDGNGVRDAGEPGLSGWRIEADLHDDGEVDDFRTTFDDGTYLFRIGPGDPAKTRKVKVDEILQPGWVRTSPLQVPSHDLESRREIAQNFGNFKLMNIGGSKFHDVNGNGVRDDGEPGLAGWVIEFDLNGDGAPETATSNGDGTYLFSGVGPGDAAAPRIFSLRERSQEGWVPTTPDSYQANIRSGLDRRDFEFGNFKTVTLRGRKINDVEADGVGPDDPGLPGWTIELIDGDGGLVGRAITDAIGSYAFDEVGPGPFTIREVQMPGWTQLFPAAGVYRFETSSGEDISGLDFVNTEGGERAIRVTKFEDKDGNGQRDVDDEGLDGWEITLFRLGTGETTTEGTATVGGQQGIVIFGDLAEDTFRVTEAGRSGWTQTTPNPADIELEEDESSSVSFGNFQHMKVQGIKFHDLNGNGIQDAGENGLPGWTIEVDLHGDGSVDESAITDGAGQFAIDSIGPGDPALPRFFEVREVPQPGWVQTFPTAIIENPIFSGVSVDARFGNFELMTLGGIKFNDRNFDGIQQSDEPGLPGWTIELDLNGDGNLDATATTDGNGRFLFRDVGPGNPASARTFVIRERLQDGWSVVSPASQEYRGTILSGLNKRDFDFANFENVELSGTKRNDLLGDGIDSSDPPLAGWTFELVDEGGSVVKTVQSDSSGRYALKVSSPVVTRFAKSSKMDGDRSPPRGTGPIKSALVAEKTRATSTSPTSRRSSSVESNMKTSTEMGPRAKKNPAWEAGGSFSPTRKAPLRK